MIALPIAGQSVQSRSERRQISFGAVYDTILPLQAEPGSAGEPVDQLVRIFESDVTMIFSFKRGKSIIKFVLRIVTILYRNLINADKVKGCFYNVM